MAEMVPVNWHWTGEERPVGESGQIWFKNLMGTDFEYHNAPEKTADAHRSGGFATLGDIGYVDDASPSEELERDLIRHVRDHLAGYKAPRSVDFEDALPRHPTGKLYKRLLRDRYWEGTGRSM